MDWTPTTTRTIDLGYEQLLTFEGRPGTRVRVLFGAMWLTEEGDERDIFARCGDEVTLHSSGRSVIEGIGAARVQVIEPRRASLASGLVRLASQASRTWRTQIRLRDVLARSVLLAMAVAVSLAVLHLAAPRPLLLQEAAAPVASQARAPGSVGAVLDGLASTGTGFLAVN